MQTYKVLAVTEGKEREVPQSAIGSLPSDTQFKVVMTPYGKKLNDAKRARRREQEKEETSS